MHPRIAAGRFLIRLGGWVGSLAVAWMRPCDLLEFNRRHAHVVNTTELISRPEAADLALSKDEIVLLNHFPQPNARIILFGNGCERRALTQRGYEMTWAGDLHSSKRAFIPDSRVPSEPAAGTECYDAAWLGGIFYSQIPGRKTRVALLKQVGAVLKPGGHLGCQFLLDARAGRSLTGALLRRLFAFLTVGNFRLQTGDAIREGMEFSHAFSCWNEFEDEIKAAGFALVYSQFPPAAIYGAAIARINKSA